MFASRVFIFVFFLVAAIFIFTQMILPAFVPNLRFFWIFKRDHKVLRLLDDAKKEAENMKEATKLAREIEELKNQDEDILTFKEKR